MDRAQIDGWCERGILGVVLAILTWGTLATGAVRPQDFAVLQGLTVVGMALWVLRFWINRNHRMQWVPVCWVVVVFVLYAIIRYLLADVEYVARQELMRILVYAWLFFIVLNNLHKQETTQILVGFLLVLGMIVALYAIYQFITNSSHVWHFPKPEQYKGRGSGTFICPNHLAGFLEMLLPIALASVLASRSTAVKRVFHTYIALILLGGIGVSVSRGGWIATVLALLALFGFLARYRNYRKIALVSLAVIIIAGGVFVAKARRPQERFRLMLTPGQLESAHVRPNLWVPATRMWLDHFWFGVGPAHFDVRFPAYRPVTVQTRPHWVHNDYLNVLTDWGIVGGLLAGGVLTALALGVSKTWRYVNRAQNDLVTKRSDRAAHVLGLSVGLLALLVHSVVDFNLHIPANAILAVILTASLSSHLRFATDRYWLSPRLPGRVIVTIAGLLAIAVLGSQASRRFQEGRQLSAAERTEASREQYDHLLAAHKIEPNNAETVAKIGEVNRLISWVGGDRWEEFANEAIKWFQHGIELNPYETYNHLRYGMCLDWLGDHDQAEIAFDEAVKRDPNSYYVALLRGWHELQQSDYPESERWLTRSLELKNYANFLAERYLAIVKSRQSTASADP